ncbi:glycoside hydrolase family 3 N-terminal domain-containing protein [Niabella drilacis]|uniref:beta-N-acetylhexosaminidase n=1 Tax=Niabella drilacis (strain DSM 25811 / CCM 8410 / CCUG 62505 / LMG 26954 / E90) TaxID=1285928 RepID=A0A1G6N784_NIADE|nr:glycoside hydrolase family 3 N-terminal domain-containing protein [Niabella drilacis]SDC63663.1 beta-glucosidase [Niabella drilacis]
MKNKRLYALWILILFTCQSINAQYNSNLPADKWVDSVYKSLSKDQRIAQLIIVRAHSNKGADHVAAVANDVKNYNVGALCFFQGGPIRQANLTNYYQQLAKTPVMITIDGEYGLGMRLDSVIKFPYQMTVGAVNDTALAYEMGLAVGRQHKRLGVHVNYAPVVDINNNPNNPVIGFRSFGEDKYKVARMGVAYMRGMQDAGIMASAKHFPGHGDVAVDSHLDLPVINKTVDQLQELELYPFKELIKAGVQSVMVGHLFVPSIDNTPHRATSISKNAVTGLLRNQLGFKGLTFTDALEMQGVAKYFPGGTIAVEALIAGNDMLCLPESVPGTIKAVNEAIKKKRLSWNDIEMKVKKVLLAKYRLGLNKLSPISTGNLTEDLNAATNEVREKIARQALTVVQLVNPDGFRNEFFGRPLTGKRVAYIGFNNDGSTVLAQRLKQDFNADVYYIRYKDAVGKGGTVVKKVLEGKYDAVILGFHDVALRKGGSNYGISQNALQNWQRLNQNNAVTLVFGNPLSLGNFCMAKSLVAAYEDDAVFQDVAADWLASRFNAAGTLPVTVCTWKYGTGIIQKGTEVSYMQPIGDARFAAIDSIAEEGIKKKAYPGCVVLAAKDGQIVYHKAFGNYEYDPTHPTALNSIFDLASVTKISATTVSVMKLYEEGKIDLKKKLADYLPWTKKTDKAKLTLEDIILHQAGMVPFIPFYKATLNPDGTVRPELYRSSSTEGFTTQVARDLYIRNDYRDTIWKTILESPVVPPGKKYVYSDNDFWFLGKIVEAITKMPLEVYVQKTFYEPLHMTTTGYHPLERFPLDRIMPTEKETGFRNQLIQGTVHDEGAALGGGVAGHAGLFSDAYDLGKLYQMLLNGGELNGRRFLKWETIQYFIGYHSSISRRGYGFDKPEKDNATSSDPYPAKYASPQTYGHTGFTGTCVWVDPKYNMVYIFLSNRVYPTRNSPGLSRLSIRRDILDTLYRELIPNL